MTYSDERLLSGEPVALRPLDAVDVPALADLWVRSWQETMLAIDFEARRGWIVDFLAGPEAAARVTTVAVDGAGACQGFVTVEITRGYLHQLVVADVWKGSGAARTLISAAKMATAIDLMLDVNQENRRAVRFYEREGFARENAGSNTASGSATWRMRWSKINDRGDLKI